MAATSSPPDTQLPVDPAATPQISTAKPRRVMVVAGHRTIRQALSRALEQHGITCSMSRRGNCYDNAVMESWFSTVKSEEGERFESYAHAKEALFDYIEVFYNQRRRHSTLGQISPAAFERRAAQAA